MEEGTLSQEICLGARSWKGKNRSSPRVMRKESIIPSPVLILAHWDPLQTSDIQNCKNKFGMLDIQLVVNSYSSIRKVIGHLSMHMCVQTYMHTHTPTCAPDILLSIENISPQSSVSSLTNIGCSCLNQWRIALHTGCQQASTFRLQIHCGRKCKKAASLDLDRKCWLSTMVLLTESTPPLLCWSH